MPKALKLTEKVKRFCEEFIIDLNATQAYIRAGYSPNGSTVSASRLLAKANVQEYITKLRKEQQERAKYSADDVLTDLKALKEKCDRMDDNTNLAKSLDMFMKHYGLYEKDNRRELEVTGRPQIFFGDTSKKDEGES